MANYYEKARTNYFKVKDAAAFQKYLDLFGSIDLVVNEKTGQYALIFDEASGVPSFYLNDDDEDIEVDFIDDVSKHLTDDSILVLQAIGNEKMRYLTGYAVAVNNKGECVDVNINEIYELAKQKFGVKEISRAEY
jgi:hypothetical protein